MGMGFEFPILYREENLENLRVIVEDGKPVSLIGIWEQKILVYGHQITAGCIGSVCTDPDYRGRGYATILLQDVMKKLYRDGMDIMLVSGGRGLYLRHQCVPAGVFRAYMVDSEESRAIEEVTADVRGIELEKFSEENFEDFARIHRAEPVRHYRPYSDFKKLIWRYEGQKRMFGHEYAFVVRDDGESLAYLILRDQRNPQSGDTAPTMLLEYGGQRDAALKGIAFFAKQVKPGPVTMAIPGHDLEMHHILHRAGMKGSPTTLPGHTLRVINFPALFKKLMPFFEEMLPGEEFSALRAWDEPVAGGFGDDSADDEFKQLFGVSHIIEFSGERIQFDDGALTRLIFGCTQDNATREANLAVEGEPAILSKIFPLPLPLPGLNYV